MLSVGIASKIEYWVIPPEADAEFVACMEEVLEIYAKTYDPKNPVVTMDEQPMQLIGEIRVPIPATKDDLERVDYEYERKGTSSVFMFAEPLSSFRQAIARPRRSTVDWAVEVAHLIDTRYALCETVRLVNDNLNTHTKGAFYEAFPPDKAREYVRLNIVHTPKHGSWLNGLLRRAVWGDCIRGTTACKVRLDKSIDIPNLNKSQGN